VSTLHAQLPDPGSLRLEPVTQRLYRSDCRIAAEVIRAVLQRVGE
jgi:hypothetical protein